MTGDVTCDHAPGGFADHPDEELITSLQSASEGSRALSDEILTALGRVSRYDRMAHGTSCRVCSETPELDPTRSLDDAVALVPETWISLFGFSQQVTNGRYAGPKTGFAEIQNALEVNHRSECATPALALCACILEARAQGEG